jgi:hypothetical protein
MAPRYSDPGKPQRSSHTSLPKSDAMDRGYHRLRRASNIQNCDCSALFNKSQKNRLGPERGSVVSKKVTVLLDFFPGTLAMIYDRQSDDVVKDM